MVAYAPPAVAAPVVVPQAAPVHGKVQVALLLPLSGKNAALGQAMLNAAQLAVFDMAGSNFELMPRDTGSTTESAVLAARDAVGSDAQLLIGPLFAVDVSAVEPVAKESGLNMLALSTDVSLANSGAWVMGFAPAPQVERVIAYASQHGASRFAALIPSGAYGALVERAFVDSVRRHGGRVVAVESAAHVEALAPKRVDIDALLVPLGGNDLRQAAESLATAGFGDGKVRFLGTGLWDEARVGKTAPALVGGWYAAAEKDARETFVKNYAKTYGQEPPRLATLAYDATALAAVLAQRGGRFDRAALTNANGFAGLDGLFRLTPDGQTERSLAVNEITAEGSVVVDPALSMFR